MRPIQPNGLAAALANNISLVNKWNGLNQKERHPFDFLPMLPGAFPVATITMAVKRGPNFFNFFYPPKYNKHLLPSPSVAITSSGLLHHHVSTCPGPSPLRWKTGRL